MQTLSANNFDGKAPVREPLDKPTAKDPDLHNTPLKVIGFEPGKNGGSHGGPTASNDQSVVEAAEGEMPETPKGP